MAGSEVAERDGLQAASSEPRQPAWRIANGDPAAERELIERTGVTPLLARLLVNRGIRTPDAAAECLNPSRSQILSPFLFQNMGKAVMRIRRAIEQKEKIFIFGDADVDGVSGTAILLMTLKAFGAEAGSHIPIDGEGYGVHPDIMAGSIRDGFTLGITVDTGICEIERVEQARAGGMDVIIADHHQQKETLPDAYAILHPGVDGEPYPFKYLSGAGVAFKLAMALLYARPPFTNGPAPADFFGSLDSREADRHLFYEQFVPLAAMAAVADMMPLTGENRAIVSEGLRVMREGTGAPMGLRLLLEHLELPDPTGKDLAFLLGPLLNAPGRLGDATPALLLLTATSKKESKKLSEDLVRMNTERKDLVKQNFRRLLEMVPQQNDLARDRILCISAEGLPHGVTGIVATRIKNEFGRPVMIVLVDGGRGEGSARSVESLDLVKAVDTCADLLEKYGGHHQAVGVTVRPENIPAFFERLKKTVADRLREMPEPSLEIDAELKPEELTLETLADISRLEPFGKGNPFPKFAIFTAPLAEIRQIGDAKQHIRLRIGPTARQAVTAVGWNMVDRSAGLRRRVDAVFELSRNVWNGRTDLQLILEDIRPSEEGPGL